MPSIKTIKLIITDEILDRSYDACKSEPSNPFTNCAVADAFCEAGCTNVHVRSSYAAREGGDTPFPYPIVDFIKEFDNWRNENGKRPSPVVLTIDVPDDWVTK